MTRRLSLISVTALASLLGAALPAFAQAPAPAPMYAPPPPPPPMMAPAPAPEMMPVMPVAPVMAPKAADDMTGSVGLGVGIVAGSTGVDATTGNSTGNILIAPDTGNLMLKYWMSDAMAIVPRLTLTMAKSNSGVPGAASSATGWVFNPEVLASFVLLKGASTRLTAGAGVGIYLSKNIISNVNTTIGLNIPIELGVEHFFARWFSMGIAIHDQFIAYNKTGDAYSFGLSVNTLSYMGSLFFYTD
jgi:hypothetical protein